MSNDVLSQLTAALAGRYEVQREVGAGGMATVYLARDPKHGRKVAIKVLKPELAAGLGVDRFVREIEISAQLNHPHILPLHDSGEAGGFLYYVMPYVEGESLRDRMNREGQLSINDAIKVARDVAAALSYAHSQGVVHRDIKPENVLLSAGEAVVADFGIARALTEAASGDLTDTGISIGTPAYMSPEQASGDRRVDGRTDIYALGCLLYEMLSGDAPYTASTPHAVLAKKLAEPTPRISVVRDTVPAAVEVALQKALAKTPADRYATAQQFADALATPAEGIAQPAPAATVVTPSVPRRGSLLRPRVVVPVAVVVLALGSFGVRFVQHRADVRWAREVALPEIERLIGENDVWRNLVPPYRLAERAEAILGDDSELAQLIAQCSREIDVVTDPPGASVYMKEYADEDAEWISLGVTPLEGVRVPIGIFRWRIAKEGYDTVLAAASSWDVGGEAGLLAGANLVRTLDEADNSPDGMVRVEATETEVGPLDDFFIGRYEVTNREYKEFLDAGGYVNREYWKHLVVQDGRPLTWEEAMRRFVDQTGQPGPSTWVGGDYPPGQGEHPVAGVSWYEAAAFAEYSGMSLPTAAHWNVARGGFTPMVMWPQLGGFGILAPFTNFGGQGTVPVGSLAGITAYGAYDMPGNVREWCWNDAPRGKIVRGGSFEDNTYEFGNERQAPAMDRSRRNGFRLAFYPDSATLPETAFGLRNPGLRFDARSHTPVSDAVYQVYRDQFSYDDTPLNAAVDYSQESPGGWIHQRVSFDAAYGGERVLAHLFLPANTPPPYQTVVYFPGSASSWMQSSEDMENYYEFTMFLSYLVRGGRAVLYPVYKGTFERSSPEIVALLQQLENADSYAYTSYVIQAIKDLRRSIDYLETRDDIDSDRLAYYGMSWGGNWGAIIPAVEQRFEASVLVAAGLIGLGRPEVADLTYVSRVRTPTLILSGKYDESFPPETSSRPMLDLMATPPEDKRLILYDTDHIPPRTEYIKETLAWLDEYLGVVRR
jgi:formylglycine-generating enzyme required for sulfatase activity/dienelactone hydrolase